MPKILIIEDEIKISRFLELELLHEGYEVIIVSNGRDGLDMATNEKFDLIILDLMIPLLSGIEVCRRIRKTSDIAIIMLTAKDDISDKVMGLDSGADDYLTKPFAIEELLARIRVALKRKANVSLKSKNILQFGKLVLIKDQYKISFDKNELSLSKTEFDLLQFLMENKGIVLSREKLLENVWGFDYYGDTNIIDVYIRYLRSKIDQRFDVEYIYTIRGVGYTFKYEEK